MLIRTLPLTPAQSKEKVLDSLGAPEPIRDADVWTWQHTRAFVYQKISECPMATLLTTVVPYYYDCRWQFLIYSYLPMPNENYIKVATLIPIMFVYTDTAPAIGKTDCNVDSSL